MKKNNKRSTRGTPTTSPQKSSSSANPRSSSSVRPSSSSSAHPSSSSSDKGMQQFDENFPPNSPPTSPVKSAKQASPAESPVRQPDSKRSMRAFGPVRLLDTDKPTDTQLLAHPIHLPPNGDFHLASSLLQPQQPQPPQQLPAQAPIAQQQDVAPPPAAQQQQDVPPPPAAQQQQDVPPPPAAQQQQAVAPQPVAAQQQVVAPPAAPADAKKGWQSFNFIAVKSDSLSRKIYALPKAPEQVPPFLEFDDYATLPSLEKSCLQGSKVIDGLYLEPGEARKYFAVKTVLKSELAKFNPGKFITLKSDVDRLVSQTIREADRPTFIVAFSVDQIQHPKASLVAIGKRLTPVKNVEQNFPSFILVDQNNQRSRLYTVAEALQAAAPEQIVHYFSLPQQPQAQLQQQAQQQPSQQPQQQLSQPQQPHGLLFSQQLSAEQRLVKYIALLQPIAKDFQAINDDYVTVTRQQITALQTLMYNKEQQAGANAIYSTTELAEVREGINQIKKHHKDAVKQIQDVLEKLLFVNPTPNKQAEFAEFERLLNSVQTAFNNAKDHLEKYDSYHKELNYYQQRQQLLVLRQAFTAQLNSVNFMPVQADAAQVIAVHH